MFFTTFLQKQESHPQTHYAMILYDTLCIYVCWSWLSGKLVKSVNLVSPVKPIISATPVQPVRTGKTVKLIKPVKLVKPVNLKVHGQVPVGFQSVEMTKQVSNGLKIALTQDDGNNPMEATWDSQ